MSMQCKVQKSTQSRNTMRHFSVWLKTFWTRLLIIIYTVYRLFNFILFSLYSVSIGLRQKKYKILYVKLIFHKNFYIKIVSLLLQTLETVYLLLKRLEFRFCFCCYQKSCERIFSVSPVHKRSFFVCLYFIHFSGLCTWAGIYFIGNLWDKLCEEWNERKLWFCGGLKYQQ